MKMNLPNKLTIFRMVLIPFFVFLLLYQGLGNYGKWWALAVFLIASFTDLLDGKIARKYNLVTNFGKFMDPLADKLLVSAAMISLIQLGKLSAWIVIIIISREFIISGFRLIAADKGIVIAAGYLGKIKTVFQMIMVCLLIADISVLVLLNQVVVIITLLLTVISLLDYIVKNKDIMKDTK